MSAKYVMLTKLFYRLFRPMFVKMAEDTSNEFDDELITIADELIGTL